MSREREREGERDGRKERSKSYQRPRAGLWRKLITKPPCGVAELGGGKSELECSSSKCYFFVLCCSCNAAGWDVKHNLILRLLSSAARKSVIDFQGHTHRHTHTCRQQGRCRWARAFSIERSRNTLDLERQWTPRITINRTLDRTCSKLVEHTIKKAERVQRHNKIIVESS